MKQTDETYMRRALQLAANGRGFASPNPMVGAVVVADGRIIGEGWHRQWGKPHAEVNAIASVREADRHLIEGSTVYVTLEPCSHYGKTPPCAELLVKSRVGRVVVGCLDPFEKVSGRGVKMLRDAGIEVQTGVLQSECEQLNERFMTAHRKRRPWVMLKWAACGDGSMATAQGCPLRISNALSTVAMHRERAGVDAIMVGTTTANTDNPGLDVRHWPSRRNPLKVTFNRHGHLDSKTRIATDPESIIITEEEPLEQTLQRLYAEHGVTSLMVEGGPALLRSFIEAGLYDEIRREVNPALHPDGLKEPCIVLEGNMVVSRPNGAATDISLGAAGGEATCCR